MGYLRFLMAAFVLLTTGRLAAQTVPGLDPGKNTKDASIELTSRALLGPRAGRMAQHFPNGYWAGARTLRSLVFNLQDQDAATQESVTVEIRAQDSTTGFPDWPGNPTTPIFRTTITNPPGAGIAAWQYTVTPAQPLWSSSAAARSSGASRCASSELRSAPMDRSAARRPE